MRNIVAEPLVISGVNKKEEIDHKVREALNTVGMDPDIKDKFGFSAAYWAMENRHRPCMDFLPNPVKMSCEEIIEAFKDKQKAMGATGAKAGGKKKKKGGGKKKK